MSSRADSFRALAVLSALACVLGASGCFEDHPCRPETCDGLDNDCDGRVDENFVDATGLYVKDEHCGGCDIACSRVLPTAQTTRCDVEMGVPQCRIASCPSGKVPAGPSACVPELPVLCLPCSGDEDCDVRSPGSRCLIEPGGAGRCGRACSDISPCPDGYTCIADDDSAGDVSLAPQCRPNAGSCLCGEGMDGAELACELTQDAGHLCVGVQRCKGGTLSACEPTLNETCNEQDDDCDGKVDESFVDSHGRYTQAENCGACGVVCAAPGANMTAKCAAHGDGVRCDVACKPGFVDVDGVQATGCECALGDGPAIVVGGDADCNGEVDPTPSLVFVAPSGDDANPGTDFAKPVRTIARGIAQGFALARTVLVARGIYTEPVSLMPGVKLIGGYSPDFHEHDVELYPVLVERPNGADGKPVLRCKDISSETYVEGFTLVASDATASGHGSTAVLFEDCGPLVELSHVTVIAGRGAPGAAGDDSSSRLGSIGFSSLEQLNGIDGGNGLAGGLPDTGCPPLAGGAGSTKMCLQDVGGGNGGGANCPNLGNCDNNANPSLCGNSGCTDFTNGSGVCNIDAAIAAATPNPAATSGKGATPGHAGELTYSAPTNHSVCSFCDDNPSLARNGDDGGDGKTGADGSSGAQCDATLKLDSDGRLSADSGATGAGGKDGSGGGGGSAGAGYAVIANTVGTCSSVAGASGGGGGSGGCGAPGASGGLGGGSSVGVLVRLSSGMAAGPTFEALKIVTASGGDGGAGGIGASGGAGGNGGLGGETSFWCARNGGRGGDGGSGGAGGGGGGGCGGASYGIYLLNTSPATAYAATLSSTEVSLAGAGGHGGLGGASPGHSGPDGRDGKTLAVGVAKP